MNHDLMAVYAASEIVELLTLCQELQSEKDGRERPAPGAYSRDEDAFAERIRSACGHALLLRRLLFCCPLLGCLNLCDHFILCLNLCLICFCNSLCICQIIRNIIQFPFFCRL